MSHWRKRRIMKLENRGLTTVISEEYLVPTDSWRVTQVQQLMGGTPTTTYDRILSHPESSTEFRRLCNKAVDHDFEMPKGDNPKLMDVSSWGREQQEKIDAAYKEDS